MNVGGEKREERREAKRGKGKGREGKGVFEDMVYV